MKILPLIGGAMALACSPAALASSGVVHGRILFYENEGNYCPSSRTCTGANYLQSQWHTNLGVPDTVVYVRDSSSNIIGSGVTDANGYFTVTWYKSGSGSITGNFIWVGEHSGNRFNIRSSSGAQWIMWTSNQTLTNGTSSSSPQELGSYTWGSSSSPHGVANVYMGAWRTWNYSFSYSNRMNAYFPDLDVWMYSSVCSTSCAYGSLNRVYLDSAADYTPQGRIMHEMGHIASYKASRDQSYSFGGDYCYPSTGSGCGWSLNTAEWGAVTFEEGLATFYGDSALYWASSSQPHTCLSSSSCTTSSYNTETSSRSSCASGENRWPLSMDRYLRDAYDTNADFSGETLSRSIWEFFDTVHAFDNGTSNYQKDEPWAGGSLSDRDGRSGADFKYNWSLWGTNSSTAYTNNCSPVGD